MGGTDKRIIKILWKVKYAKIIISVFALVITGIVLFAGCGGRGKREYAVNETLYLADGANVYALEKNCDIL